MEANMDIGDLENSAFEISGWESMDGTERLQALQGIADQMVGGSGGYSVGFGSELSGDEGSSAYGHHIDFDEGSLGAMSAGEAVDRLLDGIGGFERQIDETVSQYGSVDAADGMLGDGDPSETIKDEGDAESGSRGKYGDNVSFGCVGICGTRCLTVKEPVRGWWIELNDGVP